MSASPRPRAATTPVPERIVGTVVEETDTWARRVGVRAGVSDRSTGSLGFWTTEASDDVMTRWRHWRRAFQPGFPALQMAHQVHGTTVLTHEGVGQGWHIADDADGHASAQHGLLLAVSVADCVPIYLTAGRHRAVALLHAGWRGVAGGMLAAGVQALLAVAGASAPEVSMHCGVSICGSCYEVGEEVAAAVLGPPVPRGHSHLDLRAALLQQAADFAIGELSISPYCTSCHHDRYYSHRASGGAPGRNLAWLGLPAA